MAVGLLAVGMIAPAAAVPVGTASVDGARVGVTDEPQDFVRDLSLACPDGRVPRGGFDDVAGGTFGLAIDCLSWYDITQGVGGGDFDQTGEVTRGQMAVFLHRLIEYVVEDDMPSYDGNSRFADVSSGSSQATAINVLASGQIEDLIGERVVAGFGDGSYGPGDPVRRDQMATFIARTLDGLFEYLELEQRPGYCIFVDNSQIASAHRDNVSHICSFGVAGGRGDGTYGPRENVTRGQMAAFLMRTVDVFGDIQLLDDDGEPTGETVQVIVPPDER